MADREPVELDLGTVTSYGLARENGFVGSNTAWVKKIMANATEEDVEAVDAKVDALDAKVDTQVETINDTIEQEVGAVDTKADGIAANLTTLSGVVAQKMDTDDAEAAFVPVPTASGSQGDALRNNGDGTTAWAPIGLPTDEQTGTAINAWLTAHPEATTTVQDGAITRAKLDADLQEKTDTVPDLKSAFEYGDTVPLTVDEYYNTMTGQITADVDHKYLRTGLIRIDTSKPLFVVSDYSGIDRIDIFYWQSDKTAFSYTIRYDYYFDISKNIPSDAIYVSFNIRSTNKNILANFVDYCNINTVAGYVNKQGTIMLGIPGSRLYKMKWMPVNKGDVVQAICSAPNITSCFPLAFFDTNMALVKSVSMLATDITDYCAIAPEDGYVIASSITSNFQFELHKVDFIDCIDGSINVVLPYGYYIKDSAVSSTATYNLSKCIFVPKGKTIIVYGAASSGAAIISNAETNADIELGSSGSYDYWYGYYAQNNTIVRVCGRNDVGDGLKAYIHTPKKELNGKRIFGIGDSYLAGNNLGGSDTYAKNHVWINLLALRNNMTLSNYGVNGTTVAECSAMSGTGTSPDSNNVAVCDRIDNISGNFDVIIFEGGRNDFSNGVPIGTESLSNTDKETFTGALQYIINTIINKNAEAVILGHPCWVSANGSEHSVTHLTQNDYKNAFLDVCAMNGIRCVDTGHNGIAVTQSEFRSEYFMTSSDVSHLNAVGHERYVEYVESYFN